MDYSYFTLPYISIKPNQLTTYYQSESGRGRQYDNTSNIIQPKNNNPNRNVSEKARKRIVSKINWLLRFATEKRIYNDHTNKYFTFKINFITLTLPSIQKHTDKTLKSELLNQFLTELRKDYGLLNYVWRAECQSNGSLHFHIATDTYIPWFIIRKIWNRLLRKLGYIQDYKRKYGDMRLKEYIEDSNKRGLRDLSTILKRFEYGKKTNWSDPNTTDIHSVYKINNLAAYLSKYMAKGGGTKDDKGDYKLKYRKIEGKIWGCSQSLSRCKSIILLADSKIDEFLEEGLKGIQHYFKKDDFFSFFSFSFNLLSGKYKYFIDRLFDKYKEEIGYLSGVIPEKTYNYAPIV